MRRSSQAHRGLLRLTLAGVVAFVMAAVSGTPAAYAQADGGDATADAEAQPDATAQPDAPEASSQDAAASVDGGADRADGGAGAYPAPCTVTPAATECERSAEDGIRLQEANRLRQGSLLELPLEDDAITDAGVCFSLEDASRPGVRGLPGQSWIATVEGRRLLRMRIPRFDSLNRNAQARSMVEPCVEVSLSTAHATRVVRWRVEVVSPRAAWMGALASVLVMLGLAWLLTTRSPLELITSPNGRLSLSLAQFFLWTAVTVFGVVYVWLLTETVLDLTGDALTLLGISVATSVGGKVQAVSRVAQLSQAAQKYLRKGGKPQLNDLIEIDGRPSLAKLQMVVFTVIVAVMVMWWMLEHFTFPNLDPELVLLMGVSSAAYLGNQSVTPVSLDEVEKKVQEAEDSRDPEKVKAAEASGSEGDIKAAQDSADKVKRAAAESLVARFLG